MPLGGDGVYYFSMYLLVEPAEWARFQMRLNGNTICSTLPDHSTNGINDYAPGSCSAAVDVVAGNECPIL